MKSFVAVVILICLRFSGTRSLSGEHVCLQEEKYNATVQKTHIKFVTVREYVWCLGVIPRCSKYRNVPKKETRIEEEEKIRLVPRCCPGYEENSSEECVPYCEAPCIHGDCITPNFCSCYFGFTGPACESECPPTNWGRNCAEKCNCQNKARCDAQFGNCICQSDWTGKRCDIFMNISNWSCQECGELEQVQNQSISRIDAEPLSTTHRTNAISNKSDVGADTQSNISKSEMKVTRANTATTDGEPDKSYVSESAEHEHSESSDEKQTKQTNYTAENNFSDYPMEEMKEFKGPNAITSISIITIVVGLSLVIILVAIVIILTARYRERKTLAMKRNGTNKNHGIVQNGQTRMSVFHTPLPDPPIFQNPEFSLEEVNFKNNQKLITFSQNNTINCLGLYNNITGTLELQYDYPPSSGSYCAMFKPEPPVIEPIKPEDNPGTNLEPIYDEIPASKPVPVPQVLIVNQDLRTN